METRGLPTEPALLAALNAAIAHAQTKEGKYTPRDLDDPFGRGTLAVAAQTYAVMYNGGFDFMRKMSYAAKHYGGLTSGQAAAVLNCLKADLAKDARNARSSAQDAPGAVSDTAPASIPTPADVSALNANLNGLLAGMRDAGATEASGPDANGVRTLKDDSGNVVGLAAPRLCRVCSAPNPDPLWPDCPTCRTRVMQNAPPAAPTGFAKVMQDRGAITPPVPFLQRETPTSRVDPDAGFTAARPPLVPASVQTDGTIPETFARAHWDAGRDPAMRHVRVLYTRDNGRTFGFAFVSEAGRVSVWKRYAGRADLQAAARAFESAVQP